MAVLAEQRRVKGPGGPQRKPGQLWIFLKFSPPPREIAVVGFSGKPDRAGSYVPAYMRKHGYSITGVTPTDVPGPVRTYRTLAEVPHPVDMVVLFRRSEDVPGHLDDILAVQPRVVWMQLGIRNEAVAQKLQARGIQVVQDRCLMVDHRNLGSPPQAG